MKARYLFRLVWATTMQTRFGISYAFHDLQAISSILWPAFYTGETSFRTCWRIA